MASIFSGTGLLSGLDINGIVNSLIAVDGRPRDLLKQRITGLDAQRTALLDISARLSALVSRLNDLSKVDSFNKMQLKSSNADVLNVTGGASVAPGAYSFLVKSLATTQQLVSGGFRDSDALLSAGRLTIESAAARVNRETKLAELNGYAGVQNGSFKIVDGENKEAVIDVRGIQTVGGLIDAINHSGTKITAKVQGDSIRLTDSTGLAFRVVEVDGGEVAADLGFAAGNSSGTGTITGSAVMYMSSGTPLSALNDGNGVRRLKAGSEFTITGSRDNSFAVELSGLLSETTRVERLNGANGVELGKIKITNRLGVSKEVDLTGLQTAGAIRDAINNSGAGVTVTIAGSSMIASDTTGATSGTFKIEDMDGGSTARGLGIAGSVDGQKINGRSIMRVETMADVVAAINYATGNEEGLVTASISADGTGITISDTGGGGSALRIDPQTGSMALDDLGISKAAVNAQGGAHAITGRRIMGGMDTVLLSSLNGGVGLTVRDEDGAAAIMRIADAHGQQADINLGAANTLQDVIDLVNQSGLAITAGYDASRTKLVIRNSEGTTGNITISDTQLSFAGSIGLAGQGESRKSDNLQRRYVSETTKLSDLNLGAGVSKGKIKITNSLGASATIDLSLSGITTMRDVIAEINSRSINVKASINSTGDGLILEDAAGGALKMKVDEAGGSTAKELNIKGEAVDGKIDGSFEFKLDVRAGETIGELSARINGASGLARSALINDGGVNPVRLSIGSRMTGTAGELVVDSGIEELDLTTLTRAQDAVVVVGPDANGGGLQIRSSSNTISNAVAGLTLNLTGVSATAVTVSAARDSTSVLETLKAFVSGYNDAVDRIKELTKYDVDAEQGGILLGDSTASTVSARLSRIVSRSVPGASGIFSRLSDIGIKMGDGAKLTLDEAKFQRVNDANPEEMAKFFASADTGAAVVMKEALEEITGTQGVISRRDDVLEKQKEQFNERIESISELLERKRARLLRQFQAMESALAGLQSQQAALGSLSQLAATK